MKIAHSMPDVTGVTLVGTGAAWLTADGSDALFDGKPARKARLQWPTGTPAVGQYVALQCDFATPSAVNVAALLGLVGVGAGVKIEVRGRVGAGGYTTPLGGNALTQRTVQSPDGTVGAWILANDLGTLFTGVEVRIYNDKATATWATAATTIDVGELVAMPSATWPIREGWTLAPFDPSVITRTRGQQRVGTALPTYRVLTADLVPMDTGRVRGGVDDLEMVTAALSGNRRGCVIPQYKTAGVNDYALLQRTALYGSAAELPGPTSVQRQWFGGSIVFEEVPG